MSSRAAASIVASLIAASCGAESLSPAAAARARDDGHTRERQERCANIVWQADHETGDLSQWYLDDGGGEFNSGAASSGVSQDVAHGGRYSARTTIDTPHAPDLSGTRLFRWAESHLRPEACYGAWYYFPRRYLATEWWNIFTFKSRNEAAANDAFWQLQIGNRRGRDATMYVYLTWWGPPVDGPHPGEVGLRHFEQSLRNVPVGQWTHLEVYLRQSSAFDGAIIVWQDGVELFSLNNVRTRYPSANGANEWSVNNYSSRLIPSPTTVYIDDATIRMPALAPPREP